MKNYIAKGTTLSLVAPVGGVQSGNVYFIGNMLCIAMADADAGDSFVGLVGGVVGLTKASGTTAAAGAAAYYDASAGEIAATGAASHRCGVFSEAAVSGSTDCRVRLDGVSLGDPNIDNKEVTIATGAASGTATADTDWVGATIIGCVPLSGNDKTLVSCAVDGSGVVTVTVSANETADATFSVTAILAA